MPLLTDIFSLLAASQLITIALAHCRENWNLRSLLSAALAVSLMGLALSQYSLSREIPALLTVLNNLGVFSPLIIYLLAHSIFIDQGKVKPHIWVLSIYYLLFRVIGSWFYSPSMEFSTFYFVSIYVATQFTMLYLTISAIGIIVRGYDSDLVERRRKLRVQFVTGIAVFILLLLSYGFFSFADPFLEKIGISRIEPIPGYIRSAAIFVFALGINLISFRSTDNNDKTITIGDTVLKEQLTKLSNSRPPSRAQQTIERIKKIMDEDRLYTDHGLGISELAETLDCPEHKLRAIINKEMGYKNFNQFLNHYRLQEAATRLKETDLPISSIALDVGYSSLSTFNSVFKLNYELTPTEYRNQHT